MGIIFWTFNLLFGAVFYQLNGKKINESLRQRRPAHYENTPIQIYWKFYHQNWKFSDKTTNIFYISAENIDCGCSLEPPYRGGSNEYSQSMYLNRNKKNNVYPC